MGTIFDKWNQMVDGEALAKDVKNASTNNGGDRVEVPVGQYEVKVDKMELVECKSDKHKGEPMFKAQFRILDGKLKNSCIFMNQLIVAAFSIHKVCELLRSLDSGVDVDFDGNYGHFNDTIMDVMEAIDGKLEFALDYSEDSKGFKQFEITDVFEV